MLENEDILPSPLTPLLLPPPVSKPNREKQTPALFTMAQSSLRPQSVDTANHARVNPLPSPAKFSSSSGDLQLYIDSDTSSPSVLVGPQSSSQELSLQGDSQVPHPPLLFSATHRAVSSQPPPQPTSIHTWADEVATSEQSGRSTPETFVSNWAYTGRIRGPRQRSHPLVYPPPVMSTPHTHNAHERLHMKHTQSALLRFRLHNRLLVTLQVLQEAHSPHPLVAEEIPLHLHKGVPIGHKDQTSVSTNSPIPSVLIPSNEFTCRSELPMPLLHLSTHSHPQQVPDLLDNWRTNTFKKDGKGTSH